jgi:hypothetical protein
MVGTYGNSFVYEKECRLGEGGGVYQLTSRVNTALVSTSVCQYEL